MQLEDTVSSDGGVHHGAWECRAGARGERNGLHLTQGRSCSECLSPSIRYRSRRQARNSFPSKAGTEVLDWVQVGHETQWSSNILLS